MENTIRIGTRGSQLALYQANVVKEELEQRFPQKNFQIVIIKTKGDKILDVPLSKIGDKGLFTKELEVAMFENEIDMAVHSLKDLPTRFPEGVKLGAVLKRGEVRDALISSTNRTIASLTPEDIIATSSLRRKAQLLRINKDFNIVEIRGNVNTRIRKMEEGFCTVMVMAGAGLQRLGMDSYVSELISPELVIPACSQGAIAIEIRENDPVIQGLVEGINDQNTLLATDAERAFLRTLEGGCQIPVGSYSRIDGDDFEITGFISGLNGDEFIKDTAKGSLGEAVTIATKLAEDLLLRGGREILEGIRVDSLFDVPPEEPLRDRVLISTRAAEVGDTLPDLLKAQGATVLSLPMIEIKPAALTSTEIIEIQSLVNYNWLFFTSRNGVINFFRQLIDHTGSTELPSSLKLAAVGTKTSAELDYYGYKPDLTGSENGSEELVIQFSRLFPQPDQKILLLLGNLADNTLEIGLSAHQKVQRIDVYKTVQPLSADELILSRIQQGLYDLILFTSPSTFKHFISFIDPAHWSLLKIASIGTTTSKAIMETGLIPLLTAQVSTAEGFAQAIKLHYQNQSLN